jgi:hypothetical protein
MVFSPSSSVELPAVLEINGVPSTDTSADGTKKKFKINITQKPRIVEKIPHAVPLTKGTQEYREHHKMYCKKYYEENKKYASLIKLKLNPDLFMLYALQLLHDDKEIPAEVVKKIKEINELITS